MTAKQVLLPLLNNNEKRAAQLEKLIQKECAGSTDDFNSILFEVALALRRGSTCDECMSLIKTKQVLWQNPNFSEILFKQREQDEFIVNPFEVEEGVLKCPKCSNMRTFSYSKQTRSADEPMTTFAQCMTCKHKWTYSG